MRLMDTGRAQTDRHSVSCIVMQRAENVPDAFFRFSQGKTSLFAVFASESRSARFCGAYNTYVMVNSLKQGNNYLMPPWWVHQENGSVATFVFLTLQRFDCVGVVLTFENLTLPLISALFAHLSGACYRTARRGRA